MERIRRKRKGGCRVYVGGLPSNASIKDVEYLFRKYRRRFDILLKSRFAFIEFDDYRDADDAVAKLDGEIYKGDRITVEYARGPRHKIQCRSDTLDDSSCSRALWVEKYGPPQITDFKLLISNLSTKVAWQDLKDLMRKAGDVTYVTAHKSRRHEGMVCFSSKEDMKKAIKLFSDYSLEGRNIKIVESS